MARAALYRRVSTQTQVSDGASLEIQDEKLRAYCTLQGWDIVETYEDAGLSGKNIDRPAFKQMMQDAHEKKFDVIVVYKLDRLTRSVKDFHDLAEKLDSLNIALVSVTQNLDTSTPVGRLLRNILVDFANFEREMIVERTMDSKYSLAEKGAWLGGTAPYGYKLENKKLILVPEEAIIVKGLYEDYIKGYSLRDLMREYQIKFSLIGRILWNPIYMGMVGYSKTEQTKKGVKQRKNPDEWIMAKGDHEPIISEELYNKVQEKKKSSVYIAKSTTNDQIFEGKCFCGCGKKLYYYHNRQEKSYRYYRCNNSNSTNPGCKFSILEDKIENRVIKKLNDIIPDKKYWAGIEKQLNKGNEKRVVDEINRLETEHKKNKQSIVNLIMHMSSDSGKEIAHLIAPQIKQLESKNNELRKLIEEKKTEDIKIVNLENTRQIMVEYINLWERMTREEKREAAHIMIKKMVITKDKVILTTNDPSMPDIIC